MARSRARRRQQLSGQSRWVTPGIRPFALRASLWLFKIAPGDLVKIDIEI